MQMRRTEGKMIEDHLLFAGSPTLIQTTPKGMWIYQGQNKIFIGLKISDIADSIKAMQKHFKHTADIWPLEREVGVEEGAP